MTAPQKPAAKRLWDLLKRSKQALGRSGFTLIEAMIISAMLAMTVVTFSSWSFQRARLIKSAQQKKQEQTVQTSIVTAAGQAETITQTEELMFDPTAPTPTPHL